MESHAYKPALKVRVTTPILIMMRVPKIQTLSNFINDTSVLRLNETLKSFECIFYSPSNCSTLPTIKQNTAHKHFFYDYNNSW